MLNLTNEQMERRNALLKELYDEGYRYIGRNDIGTVITGAIYVRKADFFGVWAFDNCKTIKSVVDDNEDLFPDVHWKDKEPMLIEDELNKCKQVN